jgi:hypothetical protein
MRRAVTGDDWVMFDHDLAVLRDMLMVWIDISDVSFT